MTSRTKLFAMIGGVLIIAAVGFYYVASKPPPGADPAATRGFTPH